MSKRLPYYQSEPAEYLAGDIMFCSYAAQGVFSVIRALYWQKDCKLTLTQVKKRIKGADEFIKELVEENIVKVNDDNISISFLDEQFEKASGKSIANSENGKKGAAKRWGNKGVDSESIAPPLKDDSESIAFKEEEIRRKKIIEDKKKEEEKRKLITNRKQVFISQVTEINNQSIVLELKDLNDFLDYWTEHGLNDKKMRFEKQTSFAPSRRMKTWLTNKEKFKKNDKRNNNSKPTWDDFLTSNG